MKKLGVKVKEDNTKKPKVGVKEEAVAGVDKKEFPTLLKGTKGDNEDEDDTEEEEKEEDEEGGSGGEHSNGGHFSKRKLHSNSWRYEQEEEELAPGEGEYFDISLTRMHWG